MIASPFQCLFALTSVAIMGVSQAAAQQVPELDPPFTLPEVVRMHPNVQYASTDSGALHLDLFMPRSGEGTLPAVVFVHGRGWGRGTGSRTQFWRQSVALAQKGYVSATIDYRFERGAPFPAALDDIQSAVRWLRLHAAQFHVDPNRVAVAGASTGGYLASLIGTNCWSGSDWSGTPTASRVQAVVAFNGDAVPTSADGEAAEHRMFERFLGVPFDANPVAWHDASPLAHLGPETAPFLVLHGRNDKGVPYKNAVHLHQALRDAGVHAELFTADSAGHGFFNAPPWYAPALARMETFLSAALKP